MSRLRRVLALMGAALAVTALGCTTTPPGGGGPTTTPPMGLHAAISASNTGGVAPLAVSFSSVGSSVPPDAEGVTFEWALGDGTVESGPPATHSGATHSYTEPGDYEAVLTITTTNLGQATSAPVHISVAVDPEPKLYVTTGANGGSTDPDCGPFAKPCATIQQAQANAEGTAVEVIRVTGGTYQGPIDMVSGLDISGGWTGDFTQRPTGQAANVSVIQGTATEPAVRFTGVSDSRLSGVRASGVARSSGDAVGIVVTLGGGVPSTGVSIGELSGPRTYVQGGSGPNATGVLVTGGSTVNIDNAQVDSGSTEGAGRSAYGVRAFDMSSVIVRNSLVQASSGQPGADATQVAPVAPPKSDNGTQGGYAHVGDRGVGKDGGANPPEQAGGRGGNGARGNGEGRNGSPGLGYVDEPGFGHLNGRGGIGGDWHGGAEGPGRPGENGQPGAGGTSGSAESVLAGVASEPGDLAPYYVPPTGGPGSRGGNGGGGGGGGGGDAWGAYNGGGGGGGGAGGRFGHPATAAGTGGGGSFAVYAVHAFVDLQASSFKSAEGGVGGTGQPGGPGGDGGNGAPGGSGYQASAGHYGGCGGAGGGGGGAGGGPGGPQVAVYHTGNGTLTYNFAGGTIERPSLPAGGGEGGAGGTAGRTGIGNTVTCDRDGADGDDGSDGEGGPVASIWYGTGGV